MNRMDREDKYYIDLGKLGCSEENESLNEKNYPQPNKLFNIENGEATWPEDAEDYIYWSSEADKWAEDYAKSYKVKMSPKDFLDLTTTNGADSLKVGDSLGLGKLRDLDVDEFNKEKHQNMFLQIAFRDESQPNVAQVTGHEGRHRMFALMQAGITSVDVELIADVYNTNYDKVHPFILDHITLIGQFNKSVRVRVNNPIAMSWKQHKAIRPNLKDESLKEYLDEIRDEGSGTVYSDYPVYVTDEVYKLKSMLQRADKPYRIYNLDETYYFQDASGNMTHGDMLQFAKDKGYIVGDTRISSADADFVYPEDSDEGYIVFIPKNFKGNIRYHTRLGDDSYDTCKVYYFGNLYVRDSEEYNDGLFKALGEAERTIWYDSLEGTVSITDKENNTREFDILDDLEGDIDNANTVNLITRELVKEDLNTKAKNLLDALDKEFGQEEVYMWSTYILPNGHFLNPDNSKYWNEINEEPMYEHCDFEDWAWSNGYKNLRDIYNNCIKMNVTVPYISMPDRARPTNGQLQAVKKIIDNKDSLDALDSSYIRDILPPEQAEKVFRNAVGKLVLFYTPMGHKVFDLDIYNGDDIVRELNRAYTRGQFSEAINIREDKGKDTFTFKGKKAWSGAVNTLDGTIEEVHSYKEAQNYGFHHSFYFSEEQLDKMEEGETCFFCIFNDHTIMVNAMFRFNPEDRGIELDEEFLKKRIKEQIKFIDDIDESYKSDYFELGKAGYIEDDGTFIYMDEYHGEEEDLRDLSLPEFSNTHCEEDTCVRIFKEPNSIQYKKLEEVIDEYLDNEEYCKVEINNDFYKVYSLREGACQDIYQDEIIGNWTGYKLVQFIKNYFSNKSINESMSRDEIEAIVMNKLGTSFEPVEGPSYIMRDGSFLKIWNANIDINGMSDGKSISGKPQHLDVDGLINKQIDRDAYSYFYLNKDCIRTNTGFEQYVVLSQSRPNDAQYKSLLDWMNYYFFDLKHEKLTVMDYYGSWMNHKEYKISDTTPEEIIKKIKSYYNTGELQEEFKNDKLIVYRVGQVDDFKQGLFFADSLDYFDYSDTGYSREDAEAYELDLSNAKIFDPMKEWNLSVNTWSDIRQEEEFFKEHNYTYYEYLDDVDYDDANEYHEVMTDTDYLAQYAYEEGYDVCILRDIPGDGGRSSEQTEYCVFNKNLIKKVEDESLQEKIVKKGNKWQVQSEKGRNMGTYDTKKEAEKRLQQIEYFKHLDEELQEVILSDDAFEDFCIGGNNYPDDYEYEDLDYYGILDATDNAQVGNVAIRNEISYIVIEGIEINSKGHGYGRATIEAIKKEYPNAKRIDLESVPEAVNFYKKCGFNVIYKDEESGTVYMILNLHESLKHVDEDLTESIHLIDKENENCYYTYSAYDLRNFIDDRLVHGAMSVIKICYFFESDIYLFADGYECIHEMLEEMAVEQGLVNEDELSERYLVYTKDNDDIEVIDYSEGKVFAYKNFKVFDASHNQTFKKTELYNILSWPVKEFKMINGMFEKDGKLVTSLKNESLNESKQDIEKFRQWAGDELANRFFAVKDRLDGKERDIYYWIGREKEQFNNMKNAPYWSDKIDELKQWTHNTSIEELENVIDYVEKIPTRKQIDNQAKEGSEKIYEDNRWLVLLIKNYGASVKYGKNTKWCITGTNSQYDGGYFDWEFHTENGNKFYFFIDKQKNHKYALEYKSKNNWCLYNEQDYAEVGKGQIYNYALDTLGDPWSPDYESSYPAFPQVNGLPDIQQAYRDVIVKNKKDVNDFKVESLNESNDTLYYHGTSQKGLTKLTSSINWITDDKDYAKYYALALSNDAYVYTCEADLDNVLDVGQTGLNVFALFPITKPYKVSVEMKKIADKLNLTEEQTYKLIEDALDEYPQKESEYKTKISTIVRSEAFKKILQEKGYTSIHTIEYNKPMSRYCDCYGVLDSDDIKIISSEEVHYDAKLDDK